MENNGVLLALQRPLPMGTGIVSQWFGQDKRRGDRDSPDYSVVAAVLAGHNGLDYAAPQGASVLAAHAGLCRVGHDPRGWGNYVVIDGEAVHPVTGNSIKYGTIYAHLSEITIADHEQVQPGMQVGRVGSTGFSTGPHLHLGFWVVGVWNPAYLDYIDPMQGRLLNGDV